MPSPRATMCSSASRVRASATIGAGPVRAEPLLDGRKGLYVRALARPDGSSCPRRGRSSDESDDREERIGLLGLFYAGHSPHSSPSGNVSSPSKSPTRRPSRPASTPTKACAKSSSSSPTRFAKSATPTAKVNTSRRRESCCRSCRELILNTSLSGTTRVAWTVIGVPAG